MSTLVPNDVGMADAHAAQEEQIAKFIHCLFDYDDLLQFDAYVSKKQSDEFKKANQFKRTWCEASQVLSVAAELRSHNRTRCIYVGIAPRKQIKPRGEKSGQDNVLPYHCVCADFDDKGHPDVPRESFLSFASHRVSEVGLPEPTATVATGHGCHFYWKLDKPIQVENWADIIEALAKTLGSDAGIATSTRVMRVPGFVNTKVPGQPVNCELVEVDANRIYNFQTQILPCIQGHQTVTSSSPTACPASDGIDPAKTHKARLSLEYLSDARADEYKHWVQVGMALKTCGCTVDDWITFSAKSDKFTAGECEYKWGTFNKDPNGKQVGLRRLLEMVKDDNGGTLPFENTVGTEFNEFIPFTGQGLPAFPVQALPEPLRGYAEAIARSLCVPVDLPAMIGIAVVSAASLGKYDVQVKPDWIEPTNIYSAVVMETGTKKSPAFKRIAAVLKSIEKEERRLHAAHTEFHSSDIDILKARRQKILKDIKNPKANQDTLKRDLHTVDADIERLQKEQCPPTLLADDITVEALSKLMNSNQECIAIFSAEGGLFITFDGRYSDEPPCDLFLKSYSRESFKVDRVLRSGEYLHTPSLTIGLTVQPTVLQRIKNKAALEDLGLFARFAFIAPDCNAITEKFDTVPIDANLTLAYENMVKSVYDRSKAATEIQTIKLDASATKTIWPYHDQFAERKKKLEPPRSWMAKGLGHIVRFAANLQLIKHVQSDADGKRDVVITGETLQEAIEIGEYLMEHAKYVFAVMRADEKLQLTMAIRDWIVRDHILTFSHNELHRKFQGRAAVQQSGDLNVPLRLLYEHGYIRRLAPTSTSKGGRPSVCYEVASAALSQIV